MYDFYRNKRDHAQRIAVRPNAKLPPHVNALEWELMKPGTSKIIDDAEQDIEARGFCYFRMI